MSYLEERFGIPGNVFAGYVLYKRNISWFLLKDSPHLGALSRLKVAKVGLKAFRRVGAYLKPTTRLIQMFGAHARKALFDIDEKGMELLLRGTPIAADLEIDSGYVILRLKGRGILGLGLYVNGSIRSQLPKKALREAMR